MTASIDRPDPYGPRRISVPTSTRSVPVAGPSQSRTELFNAGVKAMAHERPAAALECLDQLATSDSLEARDPLAIDALAYLSSVRWSLGDIESAQEASVQALELAPDRFAPNQKAGEMALRLGDSERAADLFLAAVRATEPGTADAKAAELSLREARRRVTRGIRHEAKGPGMTGWLHRLVAARRHPREDEGPQDQTRAELTAIR